MMVSMSWRSEVVRTSAMVAVIVLHGCAERDDDGSGDESGASGEAAKIVCKAWFECECETSHPDEGACQTTLRQAYEDEHARAEEAGLMWDRSCLATIFDRWGCGSTPTGDGDASCEICKPYYGQAADGEPCQALEGFTWASDNCGQGLLCAITDPMAGPDGICTGECPDIYLDEGEDCDVSQLCRPGLFCDTGGSGQCTPLPSEGAPCTATFDCAADLACDGSDMVCKPAPGEGEPCLDFQCAEGLVCDTGALGGADDICVPSPQVGDPCENDSDCPSLRCENGVCAPEEPAVCQFG